MIRLSSILIISFCAVACSNGYRTVGLVNSTNSEITLETSPNIRYNGYPEKFIGLEKDLSNRGLVWKYGSIDCIIVYPIVGSQPAFDSLGKYIMKPGSGLEIGDFYKPKDVEFTSNCIDLNSLKIITANDTVTFSDKEAIWNALNYDKKVKRNRKIFYDKAVVVE